MLSPLSSLLKIAHDKKMALGAFNVFNLETTLAVIQAAVKKKTPVIIQVTENTLKYVKLETITDLIKNLAKKVPVPIALHLDHGKNLSVIKNCLAAGFSSVHFDGSLLPLKKNISLTKKAAALAHQQKALIQGELGVIAGQEGKTKSKLISARLTEPALAKKFVLATGIDTLAPSVGTRHGFFPGQEKIDQPRLKKISQTVSIPLVLHGGSGVSQKEVRQAIRHGIRIINIDTEMRLAYLAALRGELLKNKKAANPRAAMKSVIAAVQKVVEKKIELFKNKS